MESNTKKLLKTGGLIILVIFFAATILIGCGRGSDPEPGPTNTPTTKPSPTTTVTGQVKDDNGPVVHAKVELEYLRQFGKMVRDVIVVYTDANGNYTIPGVEVGQQVRILAHYPDGSWLGYHDVVVLENQDPIEVTPTGPPPSKLKHNSTTHFEITNSDFSKIKKLVFEKSDLTQKEIQEIREIINKNIVKFPNRRFISERWAKRIENVDTYYDIEPHLFDRTMLKYIKKGDRMATVGCGQARNIFFFSDKIGKTGTIYAVDIDPNIKLFIELRKIRKKRMGKDYSNIIILINQFSDMKKDTLGKQIIKNNSLDVIHMEQLHIIDTIVREEIKLSKREMEDMKKFLDNAIIALKPGGILFIYEGNRIDNRIAHKVRKLLAAYNLKQIYFYSQDKGNKFLFSPPPSRMDPPGGHSGGTPHKTGKVFIGTNEKLPKRQGGLNTYGNNSDLRQRQLAPIKRDLHNPKHQIQIFKKIK